MLEDLNTVHKLTKEIERLRAGEVGGEVEGAVPTPGQFWRKMLDLDKDKRLQALEAVLETASRGVTCTLMLHEDDLNQQYEDLQSMAAEVATGKKLRRLLGIYIEALRKDQQAPIEQGTVADRLEVFLKTGEKTPVSEPGRVLCGYRWTESRRSFTCAEPVDDGGLHRGDHHAYVRQGDAADEELRMKYLEDENDALRKRLGLPLNRRTTR